MEVMLIEESGLITSYKIFKTNGVKAKLYTLQEDEKSVPAKGR